MLLTPMPCFRSVAVAAVKEVGTPGQRMGLMSVTQQKEGKIKDIRTHNKVTLFFNPS